MEKSNQELSFQIESLNKEKESLEISLQALLDQISKERNHFNEKSKAINLEAFEIRKENIKLTEQLEKNKREEENERFAFQKTLQETLISQEFMKQSLERCRSQLDERNADINVLKQKMKEKSTDEALQEQIKIKAERITQLKSQLSEEKKKNTDCNRQIKEQALEISELKKRHLIEVSNLQNKFLEKK